MRRISNRKKVQQGQDLNECPSLFGWIGSAWYSIASVSRPGLCHKVRHKTGHSRLASMQLSVQLLFSFDSYLLQIARDNLRQSCMGRDFPGRANPFPFAVVFRRSGLASIVSPDHDEEHLIWLWDGPRKTPKGVS
jgi:hypothetical protein